MSIAERKKFMRRRAEEKRIKDRKKLRKEQEKKERNQTNRAGLILALEKGDEKKVNRFFRALIQNGGINPNDDLARRAIAFNRGGERR